ncbi:oxidoreductase dehydrogenase, short chain [Legionella beliardensis]|uniref:Oxidoreductase dehydrogenase, short chain n=1 Tax=Legionella beliardensis TaxID=91822 RepID=A0A378I0Q0_9GAMM|nr:SDR family NAD(P)-dependent oxidoreductase [Legionella beliardensis]STX28729.1 oxidoreductase dehydrogenase, short chain [Legionella beliardensis]
METSKQVAVITGAANGIGFALTKNCLQRGINVVMADHAISTLCDRVEQLSGQNQADVFGVTCDVTKPEGLKHLAKQTLERFGRVDWLFNNAGICGHFEPVWELTSEHIRKVMDVNLYGVIHALHAFLPIMFNQSHRSYVINMASFYGLCSGSQLSAYAMSKHALVALSESLYFDLNRLNKPVDVSVVCPSFTNTQLLTNSTPLNNNKLHEMMSHLIERSRPADDVAKHILNELEKKTFYILPDKEVKEYCTQRTEAIINQTEPHQHNIEKLIASLSNRALKANSSVT